MHVTPKKKTVLVVEDSKLQSKMISDLLHENEMIVDLAITGKQAMEKMSQQSYDLILLDMVLPDTSGLHLLSELKNNDQTREIPVIIISGVTDKDNVVEALGKGVNDYLTKPYHPQELITRINLQLSIKQSAQDLKELNQERSKFFSILAHDIKNPFNALLGFSELLAERPTDLDDAKKDSYARAIHESAKSIYGLLDNVLAWTGAQAGLIKAVPRIFSISEIVNEILILYTYSVKTKQLVIKPDVEETCLVYADQSMISSVIRNLLSNAIKFTEAGGTISITARQSTSDVVEIRIADTGIGIEEDELSILFSRTSGNSKPGTGGEKGTGLGLILCRDFVEANGGTIDVKSEINIGTEFIITVPGSTTFKEMSNVLS